MHKSHTIVYKNKKQLSIVCCFKGLHTIVYYYTVLVVGKMDNLTHSFGKRVRSIRISKNMSQEKLADKSGLHPTYIGQIERGEKSPTLESINKLSYGLDVTLNELFFNIVDTETEIDYAVKLYNEIIVFNDDKKEKIYKIFKEITSL